MKFLLLATLISSPLLANPIAGTDSDLKADSNAVFGSMDNGFNYLLYPNSEPPGKFSVRLHISAGSLMEEEDQRGVAHFLEHMVFNGSRNFTPAELIPRMQRLGIQFGAHANAYTSFDETVYMLDLPNMNDDTVDLTFSVMRDFADGALLTKEEIDNERGVIISEKTSRDSVGFRMMVKQLGYLLPDSRLLNRLPIGTEEVILNAPRKRFTDFYNDYYTPERMTFIVVGDFDPAEIETRVRETFISLQNPENPGKTPPKDTAASGFGLRSKVFTDQEVASDDVSIISVRNHTPLPDTTANRVVQYPLAIAHGILNRRFETLARQEGTVILGGGGGRSVLFNQIEQGSLSVSPIEGEWKAAVAVMEQELRKAVQHGFTEDELNEAKVRYLNMAEEAVKRKDTRQSAGIATSLVNAINAQDVFTTPEDDLAILENALKAITTADCQKAFNQFWDTPDLSLLLTTKEAPEGTEEELKKLYLESQKVAVEAPSQEKLAPFAYTDFGPAGIVTKENKIEDLGGTQLTLSNNILVNYKQTDFQKNSISIIARFGAGQLTQPANTPGFDRFASSVFQAGGLTKHSSEDLERILAGKNVGTGFGVSEASFTLSGRTTPEDLELQLQLMCANLTAPGFRPEGERMFKMALPMIFQQIEHSMQGGMIKMGKDLAGGDHRFDFPTLEKAQSYTTEMVQNWLTPALQKSPMELSIVGDFDPDVALPLILKTFGALPARDTTQPDYAELRKIKMPSTPGAKKYTFDSKIPNATAIVAWKIPSVGKDIKTTRRFNILSAILSDRMREEIREKLGGSYSPRASASPSAELDMGILQAVAQVKPEETKKYGELMITLANKMATGGVTQDELERALKPIQSSLKESNRSNSYWLGTVLSESQTKPYKLDWARTRDQDYAGVTVEELNTLAKKYLNKQNSLLYQIVPEEVEK